MSLSSEVARRLPPSKMYYSASHIRCKISVLEKDINQICTGQFSFTDVGMKVYQYGYKYCVLDNEMLWKSKMLLYKIPHCCYAELYELSIFLEGVTY